MQLVLKRWLGWIHFWNDVTSTFSEEVSRRNFMGFAINFRDEIMDDCQLEALE